MSFFVILIISIYNILQKTLVEYFFHIRINTLLYDRRVVHKNVLIRIVITSCKLNWQTQKIKLGGA